MAAVPGTGSGSDATSHPFHRVLVAWSRKSICGYASEHDFDLLVIGPHGDGGVLHSKLGHIAQVAAQQSTVPVLLIGGR